MLAEVAATHPAYHPHQLPDRTGNRASDECDHQECQQNRSQHKGQGEELVALQAAHAVLQQFVEHATGLTVEFEQVVERPGGCRKKRLGRAFDTTLKNLGVV